MNYRSVVLCSAFALLWPALTSAQSTSAPASAAPEPAARVLPADARIAFVDFGRVAAMSKEGKALAAKVQEMRSSRESEVQKKRTEVEALEARLTQGASVLNDAAREQLRKQFERAQIDFQRLTEDAQAAVAQVQRELEQAFLEKAFPVIGALAQERKLWAVFSVGDSGLAWREPSLDISEEIARRIDAPAP